MATVKNIDKLLKDVSRSVKLEAKVNANNAVQKQSLFSKLAETKLMQKGNLKALIPGEEVTQYVKKDITSQVADDARTFRDYAHSIVRDGEKMKAAGQPLKFNMNDYGAGEAVVSGGKAKALYKEMAANTGRLDDVVAQVNQNASAGGSFYYGPQNIRQKVKSYYTDATNGSYRKGATMLAGAAIGGTAVVGNTIHRFATGGSFTRDGDGNENILNVPFI